MSRWIWISMLVVLVVGCAMYYGSLEGVPVDVAVVERGTIRTYVEERAKTRLPKIYRVTMPLAGRIRSIDLQEGDAVTADKPVAEMDPVDLDTELAESNARVQQVDQLMLSVASTIKSAEKQIDASRAKADYADREYKRKSTLAEKNVITESDRNEAELFRIESSVDHTKDVLTLSAIESMREALKLMRQEADETAKRRKRDRNRATLYSPVDGVVLQRAVSNERVLAAGEVLLEIGRLEDLEIEAEILTQDAVAIQLDDPVDVEGPAVGPKPIRASVARIYPQGFTKVSSLGVEQQRVLVIIRFETEDLAKLKASGIQLGADYRVRVRIYTDEKSDAVKVPRSALFRGADGRWQAFVIRGGRARLTQLQVGLSNDFEVEVLSGLEAGEKVILAPESSLADNQPVEPQ